MFNERSDIDSRPALVALDSPVPGQPMHHDLRCGICGHGFSHTDSWMTRCGLCRMDAVNQSYADRYRRRLI